MLPFSVLLTQAAGQCSPAGHDCRVSLVGLIAECILSVPCRRGGGARRAIRSSKVTQSPPHLPSFLCAAGSPPDPQEGTPMAPPVDRARNPGVVFNRAVSVLLESPRPASPCLSKDLAGMSVSSCCQDKVGVRMGIITASPEGPPGNIMSRGQEPGWFLGSGGTLSSLAPSGPGSSLYKTHGLPLDLKGSGNF